MLALGTFGVAIALLVSFVVLTARAGRATRHHFRLLCGELRLMGDFSKKVGVGLLVHPVAMGTFRGRLTRIETSVVPVPGGRMQAATLLTVTGANAGDFELQVRPKAAAGPVPTERYISAGDPAFDLALLVTTSNDERAQAVLTPEVRQRLLTCARLGIDGRGIEVRGDVLTYTEPGLLDRGSRRRRVRAMVDALHDIADRLEASGSSIEDAPRAPQDPAAR